MASPSDRFLDYNLRLTTGVMAWPDKEPSDYVIDINASVTYEPEDALGPVEVGVLRAQLIQLGRALNDRVSYEEVFDAHSAALFDLYCAFF